MFLANRSGGFSFMASVETKVPGAVEALIWLISPEQVHEKIPPRKSSEC